MSTNRIIAIVIVGLIHLVVGYALVTGLAYSAAKKVLERVTTVDVEEPPPPEEEPPPPPPEQTVPPPVAPPPPINIAVAPPPIQVQTVIPPPAPPVRIIPPQAPPAPPPPAPSKARGAQPDGQARWQQRIIDNYPPRAIRNEEQGTVGLAVTVNAEGRVAGCSVTSSSGSSTLDEAACTDITRFARFKPAWDDDGNPTSGRWSTRITYKLN